MAENKNNFAFSRKLMFERVKEICKEKCPVDLEKLVSILQYDTGLSKIKSKEYLKVLYDNDEINIDQTSLIVSVGDKK